MENFWLINRLTPESNTRLYQKLTWSDFQNSIGTYGLIKKLPKIDLHCHLGGSQRIEDIVAIAESFLPKDKRLIELIDQNFGTYEDLDYQDLFKEHPDKIVQTLVNKKKTKLAKAKDVAHVILFLKDKGLLNLLEKRYELLINKNNECTPQFAEVGLKEYLSLGDWGGSRLLQTGSAIKTAVDCLCRWALQHNVRYIEIRFNPKNYTREGLSIEKVYKSVQAVLKSYYTDKELFSNIIFAGSKPKTNKDTKYFNNLDKLVHDVIDHDYDEIVNDDIFTPHLVGFDLAGPEDHLNNKKMNKIKKIIGQLSAKNLFITIHCGETLQPSEYFDSVASAMRDLRAVRFGHALFSEPQHASTQEFLHYCFEMCPSSNCQVSSFKGTPWAPNGKLVYPLESYKNNRLVTINTDDPAISKTDWTREFYVASALCENGLTLRDVLQFIFNGIKSVFFYPNRIYFIKKLLTTFTRQIGTILNRYRYEFVCFRFDNLNGYLSMGNIIHIDYINFKSFRKVISPLDILNREEDWQYNHSEKTPFYAKNRRILIDRRLVGDLYQIYKHKRWLYIYGTTGSSKTTQILHDLWYLRRNYINNNSFLNICFFEDSIIVLNYKIEFLKFEILARIEQQIHEDWIIVFDDLKAIPQKDYEEKLELIHDLTKFRNVQVIITSRINWQKFRRDFGEGEFDDYFERIDILTNYISDSIDSLATRINLPVPTKSCPYDMNNFNFFFKILYLKYWDNNKSKFFEGIRTYIKNIISEVQLIDPAVDEITLLKAITLCATHTLLSNPLDADKYSFNDELKLLTEVGLFKKMFDRFYIIRNDFSGDLIKLDDGNRIRNSSMAKILIISLKKGIKLNQKISSSLFLPNKIILSIPNSSYEDPNFDIEMCLNEDLFNLDEEIDDWDEDDILTEFYTHYYTKIYLNYDICYHLRIALKNINSITFETIRFQLPVGICEENQRNFENYSIEIYKLCNRFNIEPKNNLENGFQC